MTRRQRVHSAALYYWSLIKHGKPFFLKGNFILISMYIPISSRVQVPTSVAQMDARPTSDQEVAGSTPAGSATFFRGDLIVKYFLRSFSPFRYFKKCSCHFLAKECA